MFTHHTALPYHPTELAHANVLATWEKYDGLLTWGMGQTLAILDDGCDLAHPPWQAWLPWGKKVVATWNSIDGNADCAHGPIGYHGTSVGEPSSLNCDGRVGVAYNDFVIHIRCVQRVSTSPGEAHSIARALRWVAEHHQQYNITSVNLAPGDGLAHDSPVPTTIDAELRTLRQLGIWVSGITSNAGFTNGINWPACQPLCFAIGAVVPGRDVIHRNRSPKTDILVPADYTSSSNAYIAGAAMILLEAIRKTGFDWHKEGATLPDAMMAIFRRTGTTVMDHETGIEFPRLDLLAAVDAVVTESGRSAVVPAAPWLY